MVGFDKHARGAFAASPADYGHADWYAETGLMITTQFFAMKDRRYLHTHGLKDRLLAQVAAKAFRCGELNPTPGGVRRSPRRRSCRPGSSTRR